MADAKELFRNPIQIGLIVEDLDKVLNNLEKYLGIGPFRIVDFPPTDVDVKELQMMYKGKPGNFAAKFCFIDLGNIELEVIQPLEGDNIWSDFLKTTPNGMGLHHIKFSTPTHEPIRKLMEENGVPVTQSGASVGLNKGKEWVFYGTDELVGFPVEVMNSIVDKK